MEPNNRCLMGACADSGVGPMCRCLGKRELTLAAELGPCLFGLRLLPSHILDVLLVSVVIHLARALDVTPLYLLVPYFLTSCSIYVTTVFKNDCL